MAAVNEAEAAIVQAMLALERAGVSEAAIALGTLHAAVDLLASMDGQDLLPEAVQGQLLALRLERAKFVRNLQ